MELGVTTETDPLGAGRAQQAMTEHILGLADRSGYAAALIDGVEGTVTTWQQFARTVRAAARGLSRRGLQRGDTVGVFAQDAVGHAVAVHAVRTAGGVAAPIHRASTEDIAVQLKGCRARLLITSAPLADVAVQAAERSLVRQVFAFGEAAETTPFASLLDVAEHAQPGTAGVAGAAGVAGTVGVAGANGRIGTALGYIPGQIPDFSRPRQADERGLGLTRRDVVVASPPCGVGEAYTARLDVVLAAGATIVAAPLAQVAAAVRAYKGTAAIVPAGTHVSGLPAGRVFAAG